jgi:hypothetical protein
MDFRRPLVEGAGNSKVCVMPTRRRRPTLKGIEHGVKGYRRGCGCLKCRRDMTEYQNERRRIRDEADNSGTVTPIRAARSSGEENSSPRNVNGIGLMEQAVIDETNWLSRLVLWRESSTILKSLGCTRRRIVNCCNCWIACTPRVNGSLVAGWLRCRR